MNALGRAGEGRGAGYAFCVANFFGPMVGPAPARRLCVANVAGADAGIRTGAPDTCGLLLVSPCRLNSAAFGLDKPPRTRIGGLTGNMAGKRRYKRAQAGHMR